MKITVYCGQKELEKEINEPIKLTRFLSDEGITFLEPCGGKAICGACKVQVKNNAPELSEKEKKMLSSEEQKANYRLGCQLVLDNDMTIFLPEKLVEWPDELEPKKKVIKVEKKPPMYMAIDIGTTTIAYAAIDPDTGATLLKYSMANHQSEVGSDVISRLNASIEGKGEELQHILFQDLAVGINHMETVLKRSCEDLVISANTTMVHLLMGWDCKGLGEAPFMPYSLEMWQVDLIIHGKNHHATIMPGAGAFVGGDIVSGLYSLGNAADSQNFLFVDLGTNGEIVLQYDGMRYATAVAAGPAFEAGEISCGMACLPGAIYDVSIKNGMCQLKTIEDKPAKGICGTGLISAVAAMARNNIINSEGVLSDEYGEEGYYLYRPTPYVQGVSITQDDIRMLQLAKGATRAGIELLFREAGIDENALDAVYIAGAFGQGLDPVDAAKIGLLPRNIMPITSGLGNTSLAGAIRYTRNIAKGPRNEAGYLDSMAENQRIYGFAKETAVLNLAENPRFEDTFISYMNF